MGKYFILIAFILISDYSFGQAGQIKMIVEPVTQNEEFKNLLAFQDIDYYNVKFVGDLKDKYLTIIAKEMWNGEVKKTDTLINSKRSTHTGKIALDTLSLTVIGSKSEKNKLKLFFRLPWVRMDRKYDATKSEDYSLRAIGSKINIESGIFFPAFAYILPYIQGDWKEYCTVDKSGIDVANWGKEFKLKHYIIFEMRFEN